MVSVFATRFQGAWMPILSDYLKVKLGLEVNCRGLSQHMAVLASYSRSLSTLRHAIEELQLSLIQRETTALRRTLCLVMMRWGMSDQ